MRHFESFFDTTGEYIAGKSSIIAIPISDTIDTYGYLGILNSKLISWWLKELFSSQGIDGGINFTTGMIGKIPIMENEEIMSKIATIARELSQNSYTSTTILSKQEEIDGLVYRLYCLEKVDISKIEETVK